MSSARPLPRTFSIGLPVLAAVLIVGGVVVLVEQASTLSFGWYAYAPLSGDRFTTGVDTIGWVGRGLIGLGLVVAGFWAGLLVGRRQGER